jgi:hypothetical protein
LKNGKGCNKKFNFNPDPTKLLFPCGTVTCTNDTICCNPLYGTCTKPNVAYTMICTSLLDNKINNNSTLNPINSNSSNSINSNNTFDGVQVFIGLGGSRSTTIKCICQHFARHHNVNKCNVIKTFC